MTVQIPEALKVAFHTQCVEVVTRGIGETAIAPDVTVEARVPSLSTDRWRAGLDRSTTIVNANGGLTVFHDDLWLGENNEFVRHTESEQIGEHVRPTTASEDVIRSYMLEDLRALFTPQAELGASILLHYLQEQAQAEALGLYEVGIDDILDAIKVMDGLIKAHDAKF